MQAAPPKTKSTLHRKITFEFCGSLAQWKHPAKQVKRCDDRKSWMKWLTSASLSGRWLAQPSLGVTHVLTLRNLRRSEAAVCQTNGNIWFKTNGGKRIWRRPVCGRVWTRLLLFFSPKIFFYSLFHLITIVAARCKFPKCGMNKSLFFLFSTWTAAISACCYFHS